MISVVWAIAINVILSLSLGFLAGYALGIRKVNRIVGELQRHHLRDLQGQTILSKALWDAVVAAGIDPKAIIIRAHAQIKEAMEAELSGKDAGNEQTVIGVRRRRDNRRKVWRFGHWRKSAG